MSDGQRIDIPLAELAKATMVVRSVGGREIVVCRTKSPKSSRSQTRSRNIRGSPPG